MNFGLFEDNPALPKKREKMMLTQLISHYDDLKHEHLESMVEQVERGKADFLQNEASQSTLAKIAYYLNLSDPKELLFLTSFSLITTVFLMLVDNLMTFLVTWRYHLIWRELTLSGVIIYILAGITFALIATSMGYFVSPDSDGSGIPEIKVVLSGVPMYQFYSFNSLIGKTLGIVAAIAAGMTVGKAGPYVHISCTISKQLLKVSYFDSIKNSSTGKHTMLTVGASAAIVLAFGTPVAAVVFVIEQTGTVFLISNLWKTFYVAMVCMFFRNTIQSISNLKIANMKDIASSTYGVVGNQHFIILAIMMGMYSSFLNIVLGKVAYTRRISKNKFYNNRFWWITIVSLTVSTLALLVPQLRSGILRSYTVLWSTDEDATKMLTKSSPPIIHTNSTINSTFNSSINHDTSEPHVFKDPLLSFIHPGEILILMLCIVLRSTTHIMSNASNCPLGVIGPALLIGSMIGKIYGHVINFFTGCGHEYIFAMVGASCMLSGTLHSIVPPIIIFETTGNINYLVPLLFNSLISYMISKSLCINAFDLILFIRNLPYLPSVKSSKLYSCNAKEIKEKITYYLRDYSATANADPEVGANENFLRNSIVVQELDNETRILDEVNIISSLILLFKVPHYYTMSVPIVDSAGYLKYTVNPKKLFNFVNEEFNLHKSKLDLRIQSSLKELLNYYKMKFYPPHSYFIYKIYLKVKKFFDNISETNKYKLDKYFLESSMLEILKNLKRYASINRESFLNNTLEPKKGLMDFDSSNLCIETCFSALKIQFLFTFLSMSHLFVTEKGKLCGIITKEDFIKKSMTIK